MKICTAVLFFFALVILSSAGANAASPAMPERIRIGLIREFSNRESISIGTTRIEVGHETNGVFAPLQVLESQVGFVARANASNQVVLYAGGAQVFTFTTYCHEPQIRNAGGGLMTIGGSTYRGMIALRSVNRLLTAVNIVCPEDYLQGVVPAEVVPSWHMEALKAQAVAARSYMFYMALAAPHADRAFHLCDTTCCQVYRGAGHEHERTNAAVQATRGVMLYHNNSVIMAVYFSSSGGATESSENVWVEARPYLRGVNEVTEYNPMVWTRSFTWAELTALLHAANVNIGTATGVTVTNLTPTGRVQELTIIGTNGQHRFTGDRIRTFFNGSPGGMLQSNHFHIVEAADGTPNVSVSSGHQSRTVPLSSLMALNDQQVAVPLQTAYVFDGTTTRRITPPQQAVTGGTGVTLSGRGWGHGVGMSQHGAQGMALAGFTYRQILMHYYTGVEIR